MTAPFKASLGVRSKERFLRAVGGAESTRSFTKSATPTEMAELSTVWSAATGSEPIGMSDSLKFAGTHAVLNEMFNHTPQATAEK